MSRSSSSSSSSGSSASGPGPRSAPVLSSVPAAPPGSGLSEVVLAVTARAAVQHGLVTASQLAAMGVGRSWRRTQLRRGEWEALSPRVLRRRGSPESPSQRALAGVLDVDRTAVVSHRAAAALWGVPGFALTEVEVTTSRGGATATARLARVHRPTFTIDPFSVLIGGVPVVRPSVLLVQLAPLVHPERLARLLDWFWSRHLITGESARRDIGPLLGRGRAGSTVLRELLDGLPEDYVAPSSALEARFESVLRAHGLPPMRRQVDLGDTDWRGRVDYLAQDMPLVVEIDSEMFHTSVSDDEADRRRQAHLEASGFRVARVGDTAVFHDPDSVAALVRRERRILRLRLSAGLPPADPSAPN